MSLTLPVHVLVEPSLVTPGRMLELVDKLKDFSPVLADVGVILEQEIAANFASQGFGTWAPLSSRTIAEKERLGYGGAPPLVREGALSAALTTDAPGHKFLVASDSVTVGVYGDVIPYAYWLANGTARMPARVLVQLSPGGVERILDLIKDWLGSDGVCVYADAPIEG